MASLGNIAGAVLQFTCPCQLGAGWLAAVSDFTVWLRDTAIGELLETRISDVFGKTVPWIEAAGRGGFMRRFLTLVSLLCLSIPAGISISSCTRNPGANYCNGQGYGLKITDVDTISLQPQSFGVSMAFGQTHQMTAPVARTCQGDTVTVNTFNWGTSNNQLVDISPTGNMCAGTWNRNTGGGIANYTYCYFPDPLPSTGGLPYGIAYITASAYSVTSNPIEIFVHPQVTSVTLVGPTTCQSQGTVATLDAQACFEGSNNQQQLLCAPSTVTSTSTPGYACPLPAGLTSVPDCSTSIGNLNYAVGNNSVASLNTETNQITAAQPGTTAITASIAGGSASAGYFSTCPPASISVTLANGSTQGTITQGVTQNLTTTITDTNGSTITGLLLDYQSTDPIDISVGNGAITTNFPGVATVYAICQPTTCNPVPINHFGFDGTGLSISSNPVTITTPGTASDYVWFVGSRPIAVRHSRGTAQRHGRLHGAPTLCAQLDADGPAGHQSFLRLIPRVDDLQHSPATRLPSRTPARRAWCWPSLRAISNCSSTTRCARPSTSTPLPAEYPRLLAAWAMPPPGLPTPRPCTLPTARR